MKHRRLATAMAVVVVLVASCGGGTKIDDSSGGNGGGGGGGGATTTAKPSDACAGTTLESTEVGVDASTITVAAIADTGSPIRPGLFQGSIDGMKAWAAYRNANGGLACRKIVVKDYDSKLSPADAKNSILSACTDSVAMVGTTATFINDVSPMEQCADKSGAATGLPDLAVLQTEAAQQCSKVSYVVLPTGGACPYAGSGDRTYQVGDGPFEYYLKHVSKDLHGVWVIPKDLPSTISSSMPGFRFSQQLGIKRDAEVGASGLDTQSAYTSIVQTIKDKHSTYARNGLDYKGTVFMRKEAQIQGVDSVKVWDCSVQCYDPRLITEGQAAVEGQYAWISFLPFEDKGANDTLDAFLKYDTKPDGFGAQAFAAGELFAKVVDDIVADKGPNGITRAAILEDLAKIHDFDAGGMIPSTDVGAKGSSACFVLMQVKDGKFVRVQPTKKGTFDCSGKLGSITLDPLKAFQG
jgi:hypothetical protein